MVEIVKFSCKKISKEELITCAFSLSRTEYNLLIFLLKSGKVHTVLQVSKAMKLERTTIQKAMKNLVEKGLVNKAQKNLAKGGYSFLYKPNNKDEIKGKMKKITHTWCKGVGEAIGNL